jgi:hypothetical protein
MKIIKISLIIMIIITSLPRLYSETDRPVKIIEKVNGHVEIINEIYDSFNNMVAEICYENDKIVERFEYIYNSKNLKTKYIQYFPNGLIGWHIDYFYDENDRLVKELRYRQNENLISTIVNTYNKTGLKVSTSRYESYPEYSIESTDVYIYNSDNIISRCETDGVFKGKKYHATNMYFYDNNGRNYRIDSYENDKLVKSYITIYNESGKITRESVFNNSVEEHYETKDYDHYGRIKLWCTYIDGELCRSLEYIYE